MLSLLTLPIRGLLLRSRVAWRTCTLFLAAALLPVLLLTLLLGAQLRDTEREQQQHQLAQAGAHEAGVLQARLQDAQTLLALQAGSLLRQGLLPEADGRIFARVEVQAAPPVGEAGADPLVQAQLARGASVLQHQRDAQGLRLALFQAVDPTRPELGVLRGELVPTTLWADNADQVRRAQRCVLDAAGQVLHCSDPALASLAQRLVAQPQGEGDTDWLHQAQGLALRTGYAADDWTLLMLRPEESSPVWSRLSYPLLGVLLLSLLLALLCSGVQLRRTLVPLERLIEGTRRIAREEFNHPVQLLRDDEFGQLGQALNHMAARLGQQMSTLRALAEIDHEILARADMDQVITRVQERLHELWPHAVTSMVVFDHQQSADFGIVHLHAGAQQVTAKVPSKLEPWLLERLARDYDGMWFDVGGGDLPDFLSMVAAAGAKRILVLPIFWRERIGGLMAIGLMEPREFSNELVQQARDLAHRIGLALAAQAREELLRYQAFHDPLTGLPNRALLLERLAQEIAHARRHGRQLALLYIDLDRFKKINGTQGHEAGERLLCQVAERLTSCTHEGDTVARLSGDEFVVLLPAVTAPKQVARQAAEMQGLLGEPFMIDGSSHHVGASIGAAIFPDDGELPSELLKKADMAMYRAKATGRGRVVFFEDSMNLVQQEQAVLERELRQAIPRGQLSLRYQPRVRLADGRLVAAEALLRWQHPELGNVSPERFISLAEEVGLIDDIGGWVLQQVCAQLGRWQAAGYRINVSVNISGRQFRSGRLVQQVQQALASGRAAASGLEIEVTEGTLVDDLDAAGEQLGRIRQTGVVLALDDFGIGASSLTHLQRLPFDILKIDRSFMRSLGRDADAASIVQSIIALAHALGKTAVAEGVEREQQVDLLRSWYCEQAQGQYYSAPLTADEFEDQFSPSRPAEIS